MTAQAITQPSTPRKQANTKRLVLMFVISMIIGAGAGYVIGRMLKSTPQFHPSPWTIPALVIMGLLALALHEAGHVVAGLIAGFRFQLFIAGPLRISREGDRITFGLNRIAALSGGIAACTPTSFGPELAGQMLRYTAGGPFFSLLGALALWPALQLRLTHPNISSLLMGFSLISGMLCLATLTPVRFGGFISDGARVVMLLRKNPESQRWIAMASLSGLSLAQRPRNWPPQLFEMLGDCSDGTNDASFGALLRHYWHADLKQTDSAEIWLERSLSQIECVSTGLRSVIYGAAAYFYARHAADVNTIREFFTKAEAPGVHQKSDLHIVRAAVFIAEGRRAEAATELNLAETSLKTKTPSAAEPLHEDIAEMRAIIAQKESL